MKKREQIKGLQSKGIQWNTLTSILVFLIQFIVSYFLNKMIAPGEFGKASWAAVAIGFGLFFSHFSWFEIFIRQDKVTEKQYATGFTVSLLTNAILFSFFFFGANFISSFTNDFNASSYIRIYSVLYLLNAMALVPQTKLTKDVAFKQLSQINIFSKVISSLAAIGFALLERPFLSLFFLYKGSEFIFNIALFLKSGSIPSLHWDIPYIKQHLSLASTLTFQKFAQVISNGLDSLLVGRNYSEAKVGHYTKSYGVRSMPVSFIAVSISKVTLPVLSKLQEDDQEFENVFYNTQHFLGFLLFPLFGLLFFLAQPFATAYFSDDWDIELINQLLKIFALAGIFASFDSHFNSLLKIKSTSKDIQRITIFQKVLFVIFILIGIQYGLVGVAIAKLTSSIIDFVIFGTYANLYLKSNYFRSLQSFIPTLLNTIVSGGTALFVYSQISDMESKLITFFIPAILYGLLYFVIAWLVDQRGISELQKNIFNRYE